MSFYGKGFIIDAPKVLLKTSSGNAHIATASQGQVTFNGENVEINGGWSFYYLADIDTKKMLSISMQDAQWDLDSLKLISGGAKTTAASNFYYFGTSYTIDASAYTITIPYVVVANSIEINDLTEETGVGATPAATTYTVDIGASSTTVTFDSSLAGQHVYPSYYVATTSSTILTTQTTDFAGAGSAIIQFPIYSDADASDSVIIAYAQLEVYKVKIKPTYEFSGQYKQGSQFKLELQGLDPRRTDGNMWQLIVNTV